MPYGLEEPVYRIDNGDTLIDIRLQVVRQLFHALESALFHEKDLHDNAAAFLRDPCDKDRGLQRRAVVFLGCRITDEHACDTALGDAGLGQFAAQRDQGGRAAQTAHCCITLHAQLAPALPITGRCTRTSSPRNAMKASTLRNSPRRHVATGERVF
jgi:hypothetical protein